MVLNTGDTVVEEEPQVAAAGVVETTTGAEGETTEELDYKALYEAELTERTREKETREKNERDQRSRDVQLLGQKARDQVALETRSLIKALLVKQETDGLSESEMESELTTGIAAIQSQADAGTQAEQQRLQMVDDEALLRGTSDRLGFGTEMDDDRFERVLLFWNEAVQAHRNGKHEVAEVRRKDALAEIGRVEKQVETEKTTPAERRNLSINGREARGIAAGQSRQSLVNKFAAGERMTTAEMVEAGKAMDEGIYPSGPSA